VALSSLVGPSSSASSATWVGASLVGLSSPARHGHDSLPPSLPCFRLAVAR
jgi:hypothetical protein